MGNYPEELVAPIRQDLTSVGFTELMNAEETESAIKSDGSTMVVINSVCGCAAGIARPAVKMALQVTENKPSKLVTAFAGMEVDAVNKARELMVPYPPSSPCMAFFDASGELKSVIERHEIEGRELPELVNHIVENMQAI